MAPRHASDPPNLLALVAEQISLALHTPLVSVVRFEADGMVSEPANFSPAGASVLSEVRVSGRPARIDDDGGSTVGVPIAAGGSTRGAIVVATDTEPLPADTETRLAGFAELLAAAISDAQARADLAASRSRIAAAADDERRRLVRDLHDGAQQSLVNTLIVLKLLQQAMATGAQDGPELVAEAIEKAERAMADLRELAHGILPAVLTRGGGLHAAIDALAARAAVPVEIAVSVDRLPAAIEATAYFVVAEALANVARHSSAGHAEVVARVGDGVLLVEVRDDGIGGADASGAGLVGLADRLAVVDGRLDVDSPPGGGTRLAAAIPLEPPG